MVDTCVYDDPRRRKRERRKEDERVGKEGVVEERGETQETKMVEAQGEPDTYNPGHQGLEDLQMLVGSELDVPRFGDHPWVQDVGGRVDCGVLDAEGFGEGIAYSCLASQQAAAGVLEDAGVWAGEYPVHTYWLDEYGTGNCFAVEHEAGVEWLWQ